MSSIKFKNVPVIAKLHDIDIKEKHLKVFGDHIDLLKELYDNYSKSYDLLSHSQLIYYGENYKLILSFTPHKLKGQDTVINILQLPKNKKHRRKGIYYNISLYTGNIYISIDGLDLSDNSTINTLLLIKDIVTRNSELFVPGNYDTLDDVKEALRQKFLDNSPKLLYSISDDEEVDVDSHLSIITKFLFPEAKLTSAVKSDIKQEHFVGTITNVLEVKNHRIAVFGKKDQRHAWSYYRDAQNIKEFCFHVIPHTHGMYDYMDVGRNFIYYSVPGNKSTSKISRVRYEENSCKFLITEDNPNIPTSEVWKKYFTYINNPAPGYDDVEVISNSDLEKIVLKNEAYVDEQKREQETLRKVKTKFAKAVDQLSKGERILKLNDVTYSQTEIEYEGQILRMDRSNWVADILNQAQRFYKPDDITFDYVFGKFINSMLNKSSSGHIGDIDVNVEFNRSSRKDGSIQTRYFINDIRINKAELGECLERALCYSDIEEYNAFLDQVRLCSLKFHRYLHKGIDYKIFSSINRNTYKIKLPLIRHKNINYVELDGEQYRVSDTNRLIDKSNHVINLQDLIDLLTDDSIIKDIDLDKIIDILEASKQSYKDAVEKAKKLLESVEKLFNLKVDTHEMQDGNTIQGYLINGKIRNYVVEYDPDKDDDQRHGVYEYPSGRYICIVDKSTDQVGVDKLVNRIYALNNDNLVAEKISTL